MMDRVDLARADDLLPDKYGGRRISGVLAIRRLSSRHYNRQMSEGDVCRGWIVYEVALCYRIGCAWFRSLLIGPSHLVMRRLLIMSGDVELNPGPLDGKDLCVCSISLVPRPGYEANAAYIIFHDTKPSFFVDHKTVEEIIETVDDTILGMTLLIIYTSRVPINKIIRPTYEVIMTKIGDEMMMKLMMKPMMKLL
jgi:hypothetical protein